ncbi:Metal-dependent hydrolase, beta-lactamase superfamily II [Malonomonas rubra DSM 5091]|uniref:Metal-dependent hydrolase, beta-lactamase superfamily II n=1 Tax=Malonomonas rubra DSM 5091 TaxID=1122189 RepID=A0A1M6LFQ0_MALRU|nr:hypothetical protein [Malonomonas rubra]SHJ69976.1 Metal-dependent hydrolase, beta-lactamase superfamily II [Malonomonas rubra DSM 5091]
MSRMLGYLFAMLTAPTICFSEPANISPLPEAGNNLTIHFMDVGQGDATLINCPDGNSILIDAGSSSGFPGGKLRYYLLKQGGIAGKPLEALIITRPDASKYNLVTRALDKVPVKNVYLAGSEAEYRGIKFSKWLKEIDENHKHFLQGNEISTYEIPTSEISCGDVRLSFLTASSILGRSDQNTQSMGVMISYGDFTAILTSDISTVTEIDTLDRYSTPQLNADVVKIGSNSSLASAVTDQLFETLKPKAVIVSTGQKDNAREKPLAALSNGSKAIYSTVTDGNLVLKTDGRHFQIFIP